MRRAGVEPAPVLFLKQSPLPLGYRRARAESRGLEPQRLVAAAEFSKLARHPGRLALHQRKAENSNLSAEAPIGVRSRARALRVCLPSEERGRVDRQRRSHVAQMGSGHRRPPGRFTLHSRKTPDSNWRRTLRSVRCGFQPPPRPARFVFRCPVRLGPRPSLFTRSALQQSSRAATARAPTRHR